MTTRPRITPHQKDILRDLQARSRTWNEGWVLGSDVGAPAALEHLLAKHYVQRKTEYGPRGGAHHYYRPLI